MFSSLHWKRTCSQVTLGRFIGEVDKKNIFKGVVRDFGHQTTDIYIDIQAL